MPKVDLAVLEKEAEKQKSREDDIPSKLIGGKRYFQGSNHDDWFDSLGEALDSRQRAKSVEDNKKLGLNEFGQSKDDLEKATRIKNLIKERNDLIEDIRKIEARIGAVKSGNELDEPKKKVK